MGLKALFTKLEEINEYLNEVLNGNYPQANPQIVHNLQDIFNLLPNLNIDEVVKSFSIKTNDFMHMNYVCSLIRTVIGLHNLINNRIFNQETLREQFAKEEEKKNDKKEAIKDKDDKKKEESKAKKS